MRNEVLPFLFRTARACGGEDAFTELVSKHKTLQAKNSRRDVGFSFLSSLPRGMRSLFNRGQQKGKRNKNLSALRVSAVKYCRKR